MLETLLITLVTQLATSAPDPGPAGGTRTGDSGTITAQTTTGSLHLGGTATTTNLKSLTGHTGHTGTLTDLRSIVALADPPTVPESTPAQLTAAAVLDDATLLQITPLWETVTGPVTAIDPAGRAATANVFQDETATARATYRSLTTTVELTVTNTGTDDYRTYANDGLDDAWQFTHFGLDNPDAAPLLDPDRDGQNNASEFVAGVIPTDPASRLEVSLTPTLDGLTFSPYLPDRIYTLLKSPSPDPTTLTPDATAVLSPAPSDATLTDPSPNSPLQFYRLQITFP